MTAAAAPAVLDREQQLEAFVRTLDELALADAYRAEDGLLVLPRLFCERANVERFHHLDHVAVVKAQSFDDLACIVAKDGL